MSVANAVTSAGNSGAGQGLGELTVLVVAGVLCLAFLVVGIVARRRGGRAGMWFGLSVAALVVGFLTAALS